MQRLKVVTFDVVALDVIYFVNAHAFMDLFNLNIGRFPHGYIHWGTRPLIPLELTRMCIGKR